MELTWSLGFDFIASDNKLEKLRLIEEINVNRNYETLELFKKYEFLKEHWSYLDEIFKSIIEIDFSVLANVDASEVSHQKQLLYYEALQEVI